MARQSRTSAPSPHALTVERAARLCRLLRLVSTRNQTRAALLQRLKLDVRGFYRDLKLLREVGIVVELLKGKYTLKGDAEEAIERLPFPDPHLTLGDARQLARGRSAIHRKLRALLDQIQP